MKMFLITLVAVIPGCANDYDCDGACKGKTFALGLGVIAVFFIFGVVAQWKGLVK